MPATAVVSDASVALKWFHAEGEEEVGAARQLLERYAQRTLALSVLDLTAYEIGNALLRGTPKVDAGRVAIVLEALDQLCPRLSLTAVELGEAAGLAEQHNLTLYDAAYAAAARSRGARLVTMDRDLLRSGLGQRPSELLEQLEA
jgi:predicted nucleic acid-binding protein